MWLSVILEWKKTKGLHYDKTTWFQKSYEEPKFLKFHLESTQKFELEKAAPATIQTLNFCFRKGQWRAALNSSVLKDLSSTPNLGSLILWGEKSNFFLQIMTTVLWTMMSTKKAMTINVFLPDVWVLRVPLLRLEHTTAISLTYFSSLVQHMKRPTNKKPHRFGITVTIRGKHNYTLAWVSMEMHYVVEKHSRSHATKFPPIVIGGNKEICEMQFQTVG